jgi:uncharacterized protein involved in response to NO
MSDIATVPAWRREPYRVFFPLGIVLAWSGVLHWQFHALGWLPDYRPVFHAITQIQGFMISFALGFLFTAIPRRTGTAPPAAWQMIVCAAAAAGTTIAAWWQRWAISQICWVALVTVLLVFAISRMRGGAGSRRVPNSFVWIPISFVVGLVGSFLIGTYGIFGPQAFHLHELGKLILLQGTFVGLVTGVGGMILPLLTRGEGPPDGSTSGADRATRLAHVGAAVVLLASFWLENYRSLRGGLLLRVAVILVVLVAGSRLWRLPTVPGWHRWLVWLSAWMIPAGYVVAALFPDQKKAGLHVMFIGGFALMAFAVGLHVSLVHGGAERLARGHPWQVPVFGALLILSMLCRGAADFDRQRFFLWIGLAAAAFLVATLFWLTLALPWWFRKIPSSS